MPIRPENKKRYPSDWKLRSRFIRFYRAKNKCEWCGVRNYSVGFRDNKGVFHGVSGSIFHDMAGQGLFYPSLEPLDYKTARHICTELNDIETTAGTGEKNIVIVLTVAHIYDHNPENCSLLNLAALCQKCHLNHDQKLHAENQRLNRAAESRQITLFEMTA